MIDFETKERPLGRISPKLFYKTSAVEKVINALSARGAQVRFIGGCVRDAIAGRQINDIDIATTDPPLIALDLLKQVKIKTVRTGIKHGTIIAFVYREKFEITTLRIDKETDGRHANVKYTNDWFADAARRDFTINALSLTPEGDIYDYFDGLSDLKNGLVRFVGEPNARVVEDHLRILRFFRFLSNYGRKSVDQNSFIACCKHAERVKLLSGERIRDEFLKILDGRDPIRAISMMNQASILQQILPGQYKIDYLQLMLEVEKIKINGKFIKKDRLRRLGVLLMDFNSTDINKVCKNLRLSKQQTRRLYSMNGSMPIFNKKDPKNTVLKALSDFSLEDVYDKIIVAWIKQAQMTNRLSETQISGLIELLKLTTRKQKIKFPLDGRDVLNLGVEEGPEVGAFLDAVKLWWEDGGFKASHRECLVRLEKLVAN